MLYDAKAWLELHTGSKGKNGGAISTEEEIRYANRQRGIEAIQDRHRVNNKCNGLSAPKVKLTITQNYIIKPRQFYYKVSSHINKSVRYLRGRQTGRSGSCSESDIE